MFKQAAGRKLCVFFYHCKRNISCPWIGLYSWMYRQQSSHPFFFSSESSSQDVPNFHPLSALPLMLLSFSHISIYLWCFDSKLEPLQLVFVPNLHCSLPSVHISKRLWRLFFQLSRHPFLKFTPVVTSEAVAPPCHICHFPLIDIVRLLSAPSHAPVQGWFWLSGGYTCCVCVCEGLQTQKGSVLSGDGKA